MSEKNKKSFFYAIRDLFHSGFMKTQNNMMEMMGMGRAAAISALILTLLVAVLIIFLFIRSAPPKTIIMTSGENNSTFRKIADRYAKILARNGVTLKVLSSEGSLQNLERLANPKFRVDVGLVQSGLTKGHNIENLMSLGSVNYVPLFVFYKDAQPVEVLSQLKGKRLAIGPEGSGTNALTRTLLEMNGIEPEGDTKLSEMDDEEAAADLLSGRLMPCFSWPIQLLPT